MIEKIGLYVFAFAILYLLALTVVIALLYAHGEREREAELRADGGVDLAGDERPGELKIRLRCTRCPGGDDEAPGGALTIPYRRDGDPESIVRCRDCGKKHSRDSLEVLDP